jgi:uncharacterized membrane protein (DUF106 family)
MIDFRGEVLKMKEELKEVEKEQQSFAMEFVHTLKVQNKRMFICWLVTFIAFIGLLGYTIWLTNDIETITTEVTQDTENGYNNYIGNDGEIINGETKD